MSTEPCTSIYIYIYRERESECLLSILYIYTYRWIYIRSQCPLSHKPVSTEPPTYIYIYTSTVRANVRCICTDIYSQGQYALILIYICTYIQSPCQLSHKPMFTEHPVYMYIDDRSPCLPSLVYICIYLFIANIHCTSCVCIYMCIYIILEPLSTEPPTYIRIWFEPMCTEP